MTKTLEEISSGAKILGDGKIQITGIEHDSRKITAGNLFVCIEGAHVDGHKFINQAAEKGAVAILTTHKDIHPPEGISALIVEDMSALAEIVPKFYDYPAKKMRVIGVTGTNGKTTTTFMIREILIRAGFKVGLIGTIQMMIGKEIFPVHNTTPNVLDLQKNFAQMRDKNVDFVVMEVSSHALAENRIAGIDFEAAVFTNLTQDHLDYHKTMENYCATKAKLFALAKSAAVVNIDDAAGAVMLENAHCQKITYAIEKNADLRAENVNVRADGMSFKISNLLNLNLHVTGIFNVYNVLAAIGAARAVNIPADTIKAALEAFKSVSGRFERVYADVPFTVIVDYAHTPDGVKNVIETARKITKNKIITVFGCGGDRDKTKRPIMGRIAAELSDVVITTNDNPRTESPNEILRDIDVGVKEKIGDKYYERIPDRRRAIYRAVSMARAGDIVLILGKGHENYQILREETIHFDDREVALEMINDLHITKLDLYDIFLANGIRPLPEKNFVFSGVTTDSRKVTEGALFVALKGENFNGEDFAQDAINKGAAAVLVSKSAKNIDGVAVRVDDTLTAYQKIAGFWRGLFNIPVVAITGSSGKTTTKDLTAAVLSSLGKVCKTAANFNNEIGVPMTLLELNDSHSAAVVEIGMRGLGQIENLAQFVKPNIAIVTNVNETHIELLGSLENIARAKGELVRAIKSGGTVILNADNPYTLNMKNLAAPNVRILTYALENAADLTAENIFVNGSMTQFVLKYGGESYDFEIPVIGRHNVSNALAAIAAGLTVGLTIDEIKRGLETLTTTKMRFEVIHRDGLTIINDAYNASPASMRAAIKTVAEVYDARKIAVLGDMLELGDISKKVHREIGAELVENKFAALVTFGELGKFIADGAKDAGLEKIFVTDTHEAAAKKIREIAQAGDVILFKASHGMHLEKVIELI